MTQRLVPFKKPKQSSKMFKKITDFVFYLLHLINVGFLWLFRKLYGLCPRKATSMTLSCLLPNGTIVKGNNMSVVMRNDQKISFTLAFEDNYGNPVTDLGSKPEWHVSDADLATLEVSEDGLSATVVPSGPRGSVLVSVKVDADPDEDYEELVGQAELSIVAGKATLIRMSGVLSDKSVAVVEPETPAQ